MNFTTLMAQKLRDSGYPLARGVLYDKARSLLLKNRRSPAAALDGFIDAVLRDPQLAEGFVRQCGLAYLEVIEDDVSGKAVTSRAADGGGQRPFDTQATGAPSTSTGIGGDADAAGTGQRPSDTHAGVARPAALRHGTPSTTAGGGQPHVDTHHAGASPTSPETWTPGDIRRALPDDYTIVTEHPRRKPGRPGLPDIGIEKPSRLVMKPAKKPHVSPEVRFASWRSTTAGALAILGGIMVNNRPLAHVTVGEARKWAEKHRINGEEFIAKGRAFALEAAKVEALTHGMPDNEVVGNYGKFFDDKEALRRLNAVEAADAA